MASIENCASNTLLIIGIIASIAICTCMPRLCGRELADALKTICNNDYNGFGRISESPEQSNRNQVNENSAYEYTSVQFLSKLTGGVLSPRVRRKRHGVSDECCKQSCTFKELSSYCTKPTL